MQVQETSLKAYFGEIYDNLGNRQKVVLEALKERENFTNQELADFLGFPINTVTPRVKELRDLGLVRKFTTRPCKSTGRTAIAWELVINNGQRGFDF